MKLTMTTAQYKAHVLTPMNELQRMIIDLDLESPAIEALYEKVTDHIEDLEHGLRAIEKGKAYAVLPKEQENELRTQNEHFNRIEDGAITRALNKSIFSQ
tara:strand:- start:250 stop:549 length:300 start_codon:yes stop_codon:yes gene_type:complete